jgi:hypothetical protein
MLQKLRGGAFRLIGICSLSLFLSNACSSQTQSPAATSADQQLSPYEELARSKVAEQLGVETTELSVLSSQQVLFNDSSLNCPQPGMMYAQVITEGYQVFVVAEGKTYDVRVTGEYALICETPGNMPAAKPRVTR